MTSEDPLAGLDDVPWETLTHAYGSAGDVPELLRALLSEDPEVREEVVWALHGTIFHQGTRYEATRYAVPFLARLTLAEATPDRHRVLGLLGAMAIGYDSARLPQGYDPRIDRRAFDEARAETPESWERKLDAWVAEESDPWQRKFRERMRATKGLEAHVRDAEAVVRAYDAVRAEVPALLRLIESEPESESESEKLELRTAVAYLLAWFPEEAELSVPTLVALIDREAEVGVTATAIVALGLLGDVQMVPVIRPYLAGPEPALRWAAAVALARLGDSSTDVVAELVASCAEPPEPTTPSVPFLEGDYRGLAAKSLVSVTSTAPLSTTDYEAVLRGLCATAEEESFSIAAAALHLAFPAGPLESLPPFERLAEHQQRLIRTLAQMNRQTWTWGDFTDIVGEWRLPTQRDELRAYAGLAD